MISWTIFFPPFRMPPLCWWQAQKLIFPPLIIEMLRPFSVQVVPFSFSPFSLFFFFFFNRSSSSAPVWHRLLDLSEYQHDRASAQSKAMVEHRNEKSVV